MKLNPEVRRKKGQTKTTRLCVIVKSVNFEKIRNTDLKFKIFHKWQNEVYPQELNTIQWIACNGLELQVS